MNTLLPFGIQGTDLTPSKMNIHIADNGFTDQAYHQACGHGVDQLLIKAMKAQSLDNLSIVMIGLRGFKLSLEKAFQTRYGLSHQ